MSEPQPFEPRRFHAQFDIAMIVACSENGIIGREGDLPWRLPDDLKHFMRSTKGCPVIMGRKTFDTLDQPLPGRLNIVLSRSMQAHGEDGVRFARDLEESIKIARESICEDGQDRPIWIAGGGTIYEQAMGRADLIVRTLVETTVGGDASFPAIDEERWELRHAEHHDADERHAYPFTFEWWCRRT